MNNLWDHTGAAGAGYAQPAPLVPESELNLATSLLRKEAPRCCLSEPEMVRHYTNLSRRNFGIDTDSSPWVVHHEAQPSRERGHCTDAGHL